MVDVEELQRFDLFESLPPAVLQTLAARTEKRHFPPGAAIVKQGAVGDYFYLIWSGRVAVYRHLPDGSRERVNELGPGEFFGESALLSPDNRRNATVEALTPVEVLCVDRSTFLGLYRGYPEWAEAISTTAKLRTEFGVSFPEREPDEVGLVLVRRHPYALIEAALPVVAIGFVAAFAFMFLATVLRSPIAYLVLSWLLLALGIGLASWWIYVNWRSDLLIVTSRRVVHIERVPLYSENRVLAPIEQIRTVTTKMSSALGRILGYKDVEIQTGTTLQTIVFTSVENAEEIAAKILRARDRAVSRREREEQSEIKQRLRLRFGLLTEEPAPSADQDRAVNGQDGQGEIRPGRWWVIRRYLFPSLTIREGNTVVWRRHWYILICKTIVPGLALLVLTGFSLWAFTEPAMTTVLQWPLFWVMFAIAWFGVLFGFFWRYEDWYNDYYIATASQIIDRNSLPFGFYEKREVVTFEAVQNVRVDLPKWTYKLLNMGHVYIDTIGGTEPTKFDSVFDPLGIQREIFDRLEAQRVRRRREEVVERSKELSDWFAAYRDLIEPSRPQLGPAPSAGGPALDG